MIPTFWRQGTIQRVVDMHTGTLCISEYGGGKGKRHIWGFRVNSYQFYSVRVGVIGTQPLVSKGHVHVSIVVLQRGWKVIVAVSIK